MTEKTTNTHALSAADLDARLSDLDARLSDLENRVLTPPQENWCKADTKAGERCPFDAVDGGLCRMHWRVANREPVARDPFAPWGGERVTAALREVFALPDAWRRSSNKAAGDTWAGVALAAALGENIGPMGQRNREQKSTARRIVKLLAYCAAVDLSATDFMVDAHRHERPVIVAGHALK